MKKEVYAVRKELAADPKESSVKPEVGQAHGNGKPAAVRYATGEQFKNAHRKTRALHAGLFRRLAE
jgi:hypothetical protein